MDGAGQTEVHWIGTPMDGVRENELERRTPMSETNAGKLAGMGNFAPGPGVWIRGRNFGTRSFQKSLAKLAFCALTVFGAILGKVWDCGVFDPGSSCFAQNAESVSNGAKPFALLLETLEQMPDPSVPLRSLTSVRECSEFSPEVLLYLEKLALRCPEPKRVDLFMDLAFHLGEAGETDHAVRLCENAVKLANSLDAAAEAEENEAGASDAEEDPLIWDEPQPLIWEVQNQLSFQAIYFLEKRPELGTRLAELRENTPNECTPEVLEDSFSRLMYFVSENQIFCLRAIQGDEAGARAQFAKIKEKILLVPDFEDRLPLAEMLFRQVVLLKDWELGEKMFREVLESREAHVTSWGFRNPDRADFYLRLGEYEKAREVENSAFIEGRILSDRMQKAIWAEDREMADAILAECAPDPEMHDVRDDLLEEMARWMMGKDLKEAQKYAFQMSPDDARTYLCRHIAENWMMRGELENALAVVRKFHHPKTRLAILRGCAEVRKLSLEDRTRLAEELRKIPEDVWLRAIQEELRGFTKSSEKRIEQKAKSRLKLLKATVWLRLGKLEDAERAILEIQEVNADEMTLSYGQGWRKLSAELETELKFRSFRTPEEAIRFFNGLEEGALYTLEPAAILGDQLFLLTGRFAPEEYLALIEDPADRADLLLCEHFLHCGTFDELLREIEMQKLLIGRLYPW